MSAEKEREFDGRCNFPADDDVEKMLEEHFEKHGISKLEICRNFQIYARRIFLKRFLAHYELFRQVIDLPGDIVELGVYRGTTLMNWANFLEIRNMGDRQKQVFGFDNFAGFEELHEKDGKKTELKTEGSYDSEVFEEILKDALRIFDSDRFIPYKPRVKLIKGDINETLPEFIQNNPGLRVCLAHFDCDLYEPTMTGLKCLWDLVVPGGVVLFDEYGIRPWEGESKAVDEFFKGKNVEIRRFDWCANPGGYILKK